MKLLLILLWGSLLYATTSWETDFEKAKQKAVQEHRLILLNFSGSDWCGPCIRMHKEIFDSGVFEHFADSALVLLNADFPRLKKNRLTKEQELQNNALADRYNPQGHFPCTVLMDAGGKILKRWDGLPSSTAETFTSEIKSLYDTGR